LLFVVYFSNDNISVIGVVLYTSLPAALAFPKLASIVIDVAESTLLTVPS